MSEALANKAYTYLFNKIISCEYVPGQELNEKALLEETSIGRTPLREALLTLQSEKLVDIFPRKGLRVTSFSEKGIKDLYQARKIIEPTISVKYISQYSKNRLLKYMKEFENIEKLSALEEYDVDVSFHSYLIGITDNIILTEMYRSIMISQKRLAVYAAMQDSSARDGNLGQHRAIIEALLRENESALRDALILHINYSLVKSLNILRR